MEGSTQVASLQPEAYAKNIRQWDNAVLGYIIGKIPVYTPFLQFLKKLWKPRGEIQLLLHGNGFFTVKFDQAEDATSVLEGGPWTMDHRPFILRKWSPEVRMEQERLSSMPIWVRLPNLPLHLWEVDCLSRIGSIIGFPLYADSATLRCSRASYAQICVEVQASKTLPDSILVDVLPGVHKTFKIDYDWKPIACKYCQTFGHDEACCIMKPSTAKSHSEKVDNIPPKASLTKGKEKVTMQWKEIQNSANTPKGKLLADAMKGINSPNQFAALQVDSLSEELAIEDEKKLVQLKEQGKATLVQDDHLTEFKQPGKECDSVSIALSNDHILGGRFSGYSNRGRNRPNPS
ncbi:hypothetical protein QJS04_geneDACA024090 [Acorus gramineus]|uniref:DUF4283 domain-containing protein n=1 Tax=Acorus gramineus TaxID=55184 RepID=A0AAV9BTD0_ACOGR|nr:hypothetical protein QJS04_geneDACA024090 [Acorus gramineus]